MQMKPEDRPKIILLITAIVILFLVAVVRLLPALTGQDAAATAGGTAAGTNVTPASATSANTTLAAGAGKPGQMRSFDDSMDTDAPVGAGAGFAGQANAFRVIEAPKVEMVAQVTPTRGHSVLPIFGNNGPLITPPPTAPIPTVTMVAAAPLEVVLDGVYQAGQERVAQLTIVGKDGGKDGGGKAEQTVYRRVGEYIGRFRIMGLTETGLALAGQHHAWTVGDTQKLDQGMVRAPQAQFVSPQSRMLPILSPR